MEEKPAECSDNIDVASSNQTSTDEDISSNTNENDNTDQGKQQPSYKQKEYWNDRYAVKETHYDWYCGYPELKPVFEKCYNLRKDAAILMVGCGNSKLSEDMAADGYTNIVSTDISDVVISQFSKLDRPGMRFEVQDCTQMTYSDHSFDFVFDKGTLDALSCDVGGVAVQQMLSEMMRVSKCDGAICIVSFGRLEERKGTFSTSLGFDGYSFEVCEKYLSLESQLTNIMRNVSNGLPLQLVMKSQKLLIQTMFELAKVKKLLAAEVVQSKEIDWDSVIVPTQKNPEQEEEDEDNNDDENDQEEKEETTDESGQNQINDRSKDQIPSQQDNEKETDQTRQKDNENSSSQVPEEKKTQENEESTEEGQGSNANESQEENKSENKMNQNSSRFRRQAQCFIYRISRKQQSIEVGESNQPVTESI